MGCKFMKVNIKMLDDLEIAMKIPFPVELPTELSTELRNMFGVEIRVGSGLAAGRIYPTHTAWR
jgi:hypothetical protein